MTKWLKVPDSLQIKCNIDFLEEWFLSEEFEQQLKIYIQHYFNVDSELQL